MILAFIVFLFAICIPLAMVVAPQVTVGVTASLSLSFSLAVTTALSSAGLVAVLRRSRKHIKREKALSEENRQLRGRLAELESAQPTLDVATEEDRP